MPSGSNSAQRVAGARRRQAAGRRLGRRASRGDKNGRQAARRRCPRRSARPAISSPRPNICGSSKKFAEAAAVMLKAPTRPRRAGRSRRLVDRAARAVARTGRPGRHEDRLQASSPRMRPKARPTPPTPNSMPAGMRCAASTTPRPAPTHFARIADLAEGPISLSRAYYWLGRAAEAGGPGNAKAYLPEGRGLRHDLLRPARRANASAAARSTSPIPTPSAADRQNFAGREAVSAIQPAARRRAMPRCADTLYRDLAGAADQPRRTGAACRAWPKSAATISWR